MALVLQTWRWYCKHGARTANGLIRRSHAWRHLLGSAQYVWRRNRTGNPR